MMLRVAWRSLMTRPIRAAVLAAGFGFGIAVMVVLLGVGQVILEQAHAPALMGGGDLAVHGLFGSLQSARFVLSTIRTAPQLGPRVRAISPVRRARLFLMTPKAAIPITATGGIPSLEKAVGDSEVESLSAWRDAPGDDRWVHPSAGDLLRSMDRFHPIPDSRTSSSSWAEWLYFNGRTRDGRVRVYITFFVGPPADPGMRRAGVRVQLERDGRSTTYAAGGVVDEAAVLAHAPDLEIAGNRVRLENSTYHITLALPAQQSASSTSARPRHQSPAMQPQALLSGEFFLEAENGRSLPPVTVRGAGGWVSGYVVPALSGVLRGTLRVGADAVTLTDAVGYHDHNWGFWEGVRWQWGQVAHDDVSIVYGRVFPPADVADPSRMSGFLAVLGPDGPQGFSSTVAIDDAIEGRIEVTATRGVDLKLSLAVDDTVRTASAMTATAGRASLNFLQMSGVFHVTGKVAGRDVDFTARGSAETFKP
jgi:hypothetical protein